MTQHSPLGSLDAETLTSVLDAASSAGYDSWWGRVRSSGYCARPIHLTRTTGTRTTTLYARCEDRRAHVCPACSDLYALDTWHLVHGGLDPEHMTDGTAAFVTLTAPSFGSVHTIRTRDHGTALPCHAGRSCPCAHHAVFTCPVLHPPGDPVVGTPLCGDCYDYQTHVLTTWWFPALWNRYTRTLRRLVTRHTPDATVSFIKVMEMQTRLAPHYHAIIRTNTPDNTAPIDATTVAAFAVTAAARTRLEVPTPDGMVTLRFGAQTDVQPLTDTELARRVTGYLAKYVTKNITDAPVPARIPPTHIDLLPVNDHHKRIMQTLASLATEMPDEYAGMAERLPTLGWRGHTTTKSRTYSTTMTAQKQRRAAWRAERAPEADTADDHGDAEWEYGGAGHKSRGQRYLAVSAALQHREQLRTAHLHTDTTPPRAGES